MLLVIMTKSLIRLDSIVRASLNDDCMTNSHDERQWDDNDDRTDDNTGITKGYNGGTRDYDSITRSYRREKEGERGNWNNRFRLIRKRMKSSKFGIERNTSKFSPFSMTISTLISTFTTTTITSNSTINLNLTLFEPHPTPPSHSPQTSHSPLSSPYPLSPHSIPLVTFNFTSITFCYESKSPWPISVSIPVTTVIPTSSCFTRWVVVSSLI